MVRPSTDDAPRATIANATPMIAVPAAPVKQDFCAVSGLRAAKIRCMKSMATMSPMPSATSVAQLIGAPALVWVSCSKSNGPMPRATSNPYVVPNQTTRQTVATIVMTIWIAAV